MDPSLPRGSPPPKEPPKVVRGLQQAPPLPNTCYPSISPSKKILKIGDKEITFLVNMEGKHPQPIQGVVPSTRARLGIGRGAGIVGKVELPFSRLERMQNNPHTVITQEAVESSDWLREMGGDFKRPNKECSKNEIDWLSEKEEMYTDIETDSIPTFHSDHPVVKDTIEKIPELNSQVLYIMRGCPGSGKSTLATELKGRNGRIFSTDDFFIQSNGEYVFDPKKVAVYHKRNQERAREAISEGVSPVVIDNTNTTFWEMRPYVETGLRHGYRIEFVEPSTPWRYDPDQLYVHNSHGVPVETIKRMLKRFQKYPTVETVIGKIAMRQIMEENGTKNQEYDPDLEDENLNSSTDSIDSSPLRDKASITDLNPLLSVSPSPNEDNIDRLIEDVEIPDRYSIVLETSPPVDSSIEDQVFTPPDTSPILETTTDSIDIIPHSNETTQIGTIPHDNGTIPQIESLPHSIETTPDIETIPHSIGPILPIDPLPQGIETTHTLPQDPSSIISNQERFNQQLIQELSKLPKSNTLFCLNLQSLDILQDIINIDKILLSQSNFPLAQLLLPAHVISQLSHTQIANFQHNYQKYLQHMMQSRAKIYTNQISSNTHISPKKEFRNQAVYSQARMHTQIPPVYSHQRMNNRLPAQSSSFRMDHFPFESIPAVNKLQTKPEINQSDINLQSPPTGALLTNERKQLPSNQGMFNNSEIQYQTPPIKTELSKNNLDFKQTEISLKLTNHKIPLEDKTPDTSYKLELNNGTDNNDIIEDSATLSPCDTSNSTTGTLEHSFVAMDNNSNKPYSSSRLLTNYNGETCSEQISRATIDSFKLSDNQNEFIPDSHVFPGETATETKSVLSEHQVDLPPSTSGSNQGVNIIQTDEMCLARKDTLMSYTNANEIPFLSTNITPVISSHKPELLSEKIDWGDSSDSDKCSPQILSPEGQQPDTNILTEDKSSIQWGSWTGWGSNFMTHKDKIVAKNSTNGSVKKSNFDPTIQPPRKHSTSSLKSSNEIPEFTPSFSRYKSLDSDNPENVLSLSGTKLSSSLGDSSRIMLPAGAEWEWSKSSTPILSRKNGNSETSSPRSDTDDPRNSKLNPFAVPWKPFAPSKPVQMKLDDQDKLSHLRGFFPTLPLTELKVFLKEHDNNIDRAVEAIIDQAEALNLDIPMSSQVAMPKKMRSPKISEKVTTPLDATAPEFKTVLLDDTSDKKWQQNSFESTKVPTVPPATTTTTWIDTSSLVKSFDTPSQSESNFHDVTNSESIPYVLQLDPVLAKQLIKQFGPIPGYTKEGSLDQSLSQIVLSEDTAQLIHQLWCKSAQSVDPYYVPPGQGSAWVPPDDPTQQAKHQLYSLFPGIDTHDLDQVLTAKNFSLSAANEFINTALSAPLIPKDPLTPSFALVTQRGPKSFPPLPTKTPISSNQTTKPLF